MIDEILINRLKAGEEVAFRRLYELYGEKVYKTAFMMVNDKIAAQDIVQEVFIKIFTNINNLRYNSAFNSWLYRTTINSSSSYMHENSKIKFTFDDEELDTVPEERICFNPEDNFIMSELYNEVMTKIYTLPKLQRVTIILYFYNELAIKEIAETMECSEGTVKSRLFHAKKNLKSILEQGYMNNSRGVIDYGYREID